MNLENRLHGLLAVRIQSGDVRGIPVRTGGDAHGHAKVKRLV